VELATGVLTEGEVEDPVLPVVLVEPVLPVEPLGEATVVAVVLPGIAQPSAPAVTPQANSATPAVQAVARLTVLSPSSRARARLVCVEVMPEA
jgi:hypothetical protein